MRIDNSFEIDCPPEKTWMMLTDIAQIAPCFPGAELTEVVNTNTYAGTVKVKLGPVSVTFAGEMVMESTNNELWIASAHANATAYKGLGAMESEFEFQVHATDSGSRVDVRTDVKLAGPVAQYGRGIGMISRVAQKNIDEFAQCLQLRLTTSD